MSRDAIASIVARACTEAAFRDRLVADPEGTLAPYDLTAEERAALLSGDVGQLRSLGVDVRVSKIGGTTPEEQDAWVDWVRAWQG